MSYVRVETTVPKHPKFLKAGPEASWLWVCGNAYCQDGETDGFIPEAALPYLGVPRPAPLAARLVDVNLWHKVDGGWSVHDYLKHNNSAEHIRRVRESRRQAGRLGGRSPDKPGLLNSVKQIAFGLLQRPINGSASPSTTSATATAELGKQERCAEFPQGVENSPTRVRLLRRIRSRETADGQPPMPVLAAVARDVLLAHPAEDEGELHELLKHSCAKANLLYDGGAVTQAISQARAQLRKGVAS